MKSSIIKLIIVSIFVLLTAILIIIFNPKKTSISTISDKTRQDALSNLLGHPADFSKQSSQTEYQIYLGKYFQISIPTNATHPEHDPFNFPILEAENFNLTKDRIVISILVKDATNLQSASDDPGVRLRLNDTGFEHSGTALDSIPAEKFVKIDQKTEYTAFVMKNNKLFSIAVSGSTTSKVQTLFNSLTQSFHAL